MKLIRKYGNRRLYDTTARSYVNLDQIAQMVRDGDEIQVVDATTGDDLTRGILTQIIVEETRTRDGGLPLEILRELIALSDKAKNDVFMWYMRTAFETYRRAQNLPVEFLRNLFAAKPAAPHPGDGEEVDKLRRRVDELERMLEAGKGPRRVKPS
jgi:polyhydroxyalkanoate synthesis repressor PhaR